MPIHICPDEIFMLMMALPFIGGAFHWIRHKLKGQKPCTDLKEDGSCSLGECEHVKDPSKSQEAT
jgi:hypothetical protein